MTNPFAAPPGDGGAGPKHSRTDDDASDATQTDKRNAKVPDDYLIEKTVKFRFPKKDSGHFDDPMIFHRQWTQMVQEEFGEDLQVFNNNGTKMKKIDARWTTAQHGKVFKVYDESDSRGHWH